MNEGGAGARKVHGSVEAVKVALEDALAHGGRRPARPAIGGADSRGAVGLVTPKRKTVLRRADGGVRRCVWWRACALANLRVEGGAQREPTHDPSTALMVSVRECVGRLREAFGDGGACATGMVRRRDFLEFLHVLIVQRCRPELAEEAAGVLGRRLGEEVGQDGGRCGGRDADPRGGCGRGLRGGYL